MTNPRWVRWIHSSVAKYLKSVATSIPVPSLVESIEDRTSEFEQAGDRVEIRFNGPYINNPSKGYYVASIAINVLVTSNVGGELKNAYALDDIIGKFLEALTQPIPVNKLGPASDAESDGSHLGCLHLDEGKLGVRANQFGQIDTTDGVRQGMVSAAYKIELQG